MWFKSFNKKISELEDKNDELKNLYSAVNIINEEFKNKIDELEKENKELKEIYNNDIKYRRIIDATNTDLNIEMCKLRKENKELKEELDNQQNYNIALSISNTDLNIEINKLKNENKKLKDYFESVSKMIMDGENKIAMNMINEIDKMISLDINTKKGVTNNE